MRKLINLVFFVPIAIVLVVLSVANRHLVTFSLDPINTEAPAFAVSLPLFIFLFITLIIGVLIGSCLTWVAQGKHRKTAREQSYEANRLRKESEKEVSEKKAPAQEVAPGLPLISSN